MDVCILGATGSIGANTVKVCSDLGYNIVSMSCNYNIDILTSLIEQYNLQSKLRIIAISDEESAKKFKDMNLALNAQIFSGEKANIQCIKNSNADIIVNSLVGSAGIEPSYTAVQYCKRLALANKETIVAAGHIVLQKAKDFSCEIIPIDSEHGAILQCIEENPIKNIYLTASGGPFWDKPIESFKDISPRQALQHPNWSMGNKITIDSATMMNKGFELIEASILYNLRPEQITVLIHPQSIIHSMVEFEDNSIKAQLAVVDMKPYIQYALTYPIRYKNDYGRLDLTKQSLDFHAADLEKFKCLALAYEALIAGNTMGAVLNGANDACVQRFLNKEITFLQISDIIEKVMFLHDNTATESIQKIKEISDWAYDTALIMEVCE